MPVFDPHTPAASELTHIIQTRKIPNAFLFTGSSGTGKERAAFGFAQAANCREGSDGSPCLNCRSCRKIHARMHPDMIHIHLLEKKKDISISQIREMEGVLSARPNEADWRMVLISDAGKMNIQAQNALLKALEEPPQKTFFILTALGLPGLIPTIVSRCRQIRFRSPGSREIARYLVNSWGVDPGTAKIASGTAGSDIQKALRLLNLEDPGEKPGSKKDKTKKMDWKSRRSWLLNQIPELIRAPNPLGHALFISEQLGRETEHISDWLSIMRSFFRDLCVFKTDPEKIVNLDFFDALKDISQILGCKRIIEFMDHFYETERRLGSNASIRLALDRFFIKISLP
ncbi:ATP-binding protein [Desulfospira joergensenii]|uniref:DNA polymerase III subunit n=1 Tax=Desulfospira joergensenii TaxID=53329 RepID=UPI000480736F|nr:DNA polymerase III subunit [Desulfospira joergensenii]